MAYTEADDNESKRYRSGSNSSMLRTKLNIIKKLDGMDEAELLEINAVLDPVTAENEYGLVNEDKIS